MAIIKNTKLRVRGLTVIATVFVLGQLCCGTVALAEADPVDMEVVDRETGQPLRIWHHHGRTFIAGELGDRYSLRLTNHTEGRVLVVLSVDGVNVLTGETAGYDQRGYVFDAHQSYAVTGWRKSDDEVAAFTFAPLTKSYAALTGRPSDVGVIGMAVFKEQPVIQVPAQTTRAPVTQPLLVLPAPAPPAPPAIQPRPVGPPPAGIVAPMMPIPPSPHPALATPPQAAPPAARVASASPPPSLSARSVKGVPKIPDDAKLGTAHGPREWSHINIVTFVRATASPLTVRQIEYDTFEHLVANGVIPRNTNHPPRPFPAKADREGYVPDPPSQP
jgi:hypothetical protein